MAKIFIATLPDTSHLGSSLFIGRQLLDAGHQVTWLCVESDRQKLEPYGVETLPILAETVPVDFRERMRAMGPLRRIRARLKMLGGVFRETEQDLHRLIDTHRPDLFILDAIAQWVGFVPLSRGVKVLFLSTTFPSVRLGDLPPLSSILPPPQTEEERMQIDKIWRGLLWRKKLKKGLLTLRHASKLAARCGYPRSQINPNDLWSFDLPAPKMVTCSREMDFPVADHAGYHYVGPCIDPDRDDEPYNDFPADKKPVYCVLSTLDAFIGPRETVRFFQNVIEAFAQMPEFHLLLSTSGFPFEPDGLPDNVRVVKRAPQVSVLKEARLMITHGGLNSIKEALIHAVPMIGYPLAVDQPGNVARLKYHGLGYYGGPITEADPDQICALVHALDQDKETRERVQAMSARFIADQQAQLPLKVVEQYLAADAPIGSAL
ncbi:MAG: glycosyltransferase [Acidobacteriota bacterium]|nr:glycosyltransferase [Acidobacteriota bacterium]